MAEFYGSSGPDTIQGADSSDFMEGGGGNDSLLGGNGNDTIVGGTGNDTLGGQAGSDLLLGGEGADTLNGGGGNDTLDGGEVTDKVNNSDRNLATYNIGVNGSVVVDLQAGMATNDGFGTSDVLLNITAVQGSAQNDTLTGSDRLVFEQFEGMGGNDLIDGGAIDLASGINANRATYQSVTSGGVGVNVTLNGPGVDGTATGAAGNDTLRNINQVQGTSFSDTLTGSNTTAWSESFGGGAGNDTIDGKGGNDQVRYDSATTAVNITLAVGSSDNFTEVADGQGGTDRLIHIEGIRGSNFNDTLTGSNTAGTANDFEFFQGGAGNDSIDGGGGYDRVDYGSATTGVVVTFNGGGSGTASDGQGGTDTLLNIEALRGGEYSDTLTGSDRTDTFESFEGRAGNDVIDGKAGNDRADYNNDAGAVTINLQAGLANDGFGGTDILKNIEIVRGSAFDDSIIGSTGNDHITGNPGNDTLRGNGGTDIFSYASTSGQVNPGGVDLITDFGTDDKIEIRGVQMGAGTSTGPLLNGFPTNSRVIVTVDKGVTTLKISTSGIGTNDLQITLAGVYDINGFTYTQDPASGHTNITYAGSINTAQATITGSGAIAGTAWNDSIVGSAGADTVTGADGSDTLIGGDGADSLLGGAGFDVLIGGAGNDTLDGGEITDRTNQTDRNMVIFEVAGTLVPGAGVNVNLANGTATDGLGGSDTLSNINFVRATSNNDTLQGSSEANLFEHFEPLGGNDTIIGGAIDTVTGTNNHNRVSYEGANGQVLVDLRLASNQVIADGYGGTDHLENINFIRGGNAADSLVGSDAAWAEFFDGGAGDDTIDGQGGGVDFARYERSAAGVTVTIGATGTATTTDMGTDTLLNIEGVRGSEFGDSLTGSNNTAQGSIEIFQGGGGDDTIDGAGGFDRVDYQTASFGVTVNLGLGTAIDGQGGNDSLIGIEAVRASEFNDVLIGSDRTDTIEQFEGRAGDDTIDGKGGGDRVDYSNELAAVVVDLAQGFAIDGSGDRDTLISIENARGSAFDDELVGNGFNNILEGRAGDDFIDGGAGSDTMTGGAGLDTFVVSAGVGAQNADRINDLQAGERILVPYDEDDLDQVILTGTNGSALQAGQIMIGAPDGSTTRVQIGTNDAPGTDIVFNLAGTFDPSHFVVFFNDDEGVQGLIYAPEAVNETGDGDGNWLYGSNFADVLSGGDGDDILIGYGGADSLSGGAGDDHFAAGAGADTINGGEGFDAVHYDFDPGNGGVLVNLTTNLASMAGETDILIGIEGASGTFSNDTLIGSTGGNYLEGWDGDDVLLGQRTQSSNTVGAAYADGAASAGDEIYGGFGNDTIQGSTASDTLAGGEEDYLGIDRGGADTFVFLASGNGVDRILDFGSDDTIRIVGAALGGTVGNGTTPAPMSMSVSQAGGITTLSIDTDGSGGAEVVIELAGSYAATGFTVTSSGGNSSITYTHPPITLPGTPGNDNPLNGGLGNDTITGQGGNDFIDGSGGNDSLLGGNDNDTIIGGPGNDFIDGGQGFDYLVQGNYSIEDAGMFVDLGAGTFTAPGLGTDTLSGIEGVFGSFQDDTLLGDANANHVAGQSGNDSLVGNGGNDLLEGGFGSDTLAGGDGNDLFDVKDGGGGDVDRVVDLSFGDALQVGNFSGQFSIVTADASQLMGNQIAFGAFANGVTRIFIGMDGSAGADRSIDLVGDYGAANFLRLGQVEAGGQTRFGDFLLYDATATAPQDKSGGAGNDSLTGSNVNDTLAGNDGQDTLTGFDGDDQLSGGTGWDHLRGGAGNDTLDGGADIDIADYSFSGGIAVMADLASHSVTGEGSDVLVSIEGVFGAGGNDTLLGDGNSNQLFGNFGNDSISGGAGDDWISSGVGNDTMTGGAGIDVFSIDQGNSGETDRITDFGVGDALQLSTFGLGNTWTLLSGAPGGSGLLANQIAFGAPSVGVTRLFIGTDGNAGADRFVDLVGTFSASDLVKVTQLQFGSFQVNGDIFQFQSSAPQAIDGDATSETLAGGAGDDTISGFAGADLLVGNDGNDSLLGGDDGDILQGGLGNDVLDGGDGVDTAQYHFSLAPVTVHLGNGTASGEGADSLASIEQVIGSNFADHITGSAGDDTLNGMDGNDTLAGGDGNDRFDGGQGADSIDGGGGDNDVAQYGFWGRNDAVTIVVADAVGGTRLQADGYGSTDTLLNIDQVHVFGGNGNDTFSGSSGADWLEGNQGDDMLTGNGGGDTFAWSADRFDLGRDLVTDFGEGDVLHFRFMPIVGIADGGDGSLLRGQVAVSATGGTTTLAIGLDNIAGADLFIDLTGTFTAANFNFANDVAGGHGNLQFQQPGGDSPTEGADTLAGDGADNFIDALGGDDSVSGQAGHDTLIGNGGNDTLRGGDGFDRLEGQSGNDVIDGGADYDLAVYNFGALASAVTFSVTHIPGQTSTQVDSFGGTDTLIDIEEVQVFGSAHGDVFIGGDAREFLEGDGGNDTLTGNGGPDTFSWQPNAGDLGRDLVTDFNFGDSLHFRYMPVLHLAASDAVGTGLTAGQVGVFYDAATHITTISIGVDGNPGADLFIDLAGRFEAGNFGINNDAANGHGNLVFTASSSSDFINGSNGPDLIDGQGGSDVIRGFGGDDTLLGGAGDDRLDGGAGNDSIDGVGDLSGGNGVGDWVTYSGASMGVGVNLGAQTAQDGQGGTDTILNVENAEGTQYQDTLVGSGGANHLRGNAGNDTLDGGGGTQDAAEYWFRDAAQGVNFSVTFTAGASSFQSDGLGGVDTLVNIEEVHVFGSQHDDTITGNGNGLQFIEGWEGDDSLTGGGGGDMFAWDASAAANLGRDFIADFGADDHLHFRFLPITLTMDGGAGSLLAGQVSFSYSGGITTVSVDVDSVAGADIVFDMAGEFHAADFEFNNNQHGTLSYTGDGTPPPITPTEGDDLLNGSPGPDLIDALGGNDQVFGGGGDDTLAGGAGDDFLDGGAGNDSIDGGSHNFADTIGFGSAATGVSVDLAQGRVFNDGTGGVDTITGIENISGTQYDDTLVGDGVGNFFNPGAGNDIVTGGGASGFNQDVVSYEDLGAGVTVNLVTGRSGGAAGVDTLSGIGGVHGSHHDDTITLANGGYAMGRAGNDMLVAGTGGSNLTGGSGNDTLVGGSGNDFADYQEHTTNFDGSATAITGNGVNVNLGNGTAIDNWGHTDSLSGIEGVSGSQFNDTLVGNTSANTLQGNSGNDSLDGGDNDDQLSGGDGNDTQLGGNGNDRLQGDAGNDSLDGGSGNDTAIYAFGGMQSGVAVTFTYTAGTTGTQADGLGGTDTLSSIEELHAYGGTGADTFVGAGGREFLEGWEGDDVLTGNGGNDTFAWAPDAGNLGRDRVTDFGAGDNLHFRGLQISSIANGDGSSLARGQMAIGAYNAGTNTTTIRVGVDGTAGGDLTIDLSGNYTAANFSIGNDTVNGHGNVGFVNTFGATNGNDTLTGTPGVDSIRGFGGADVLNGQDGDDNLWGGSGNDTLNGGNGFDTARYDETGNDTATPTGNGVNVDLANGTATDNWGNTDSLNSIEIVSGSDFNDTLTGGNAANDGFEGFRGGKGNDVINGGSGFDRAYYDSSTTGVTVTLGGLSDGTASDGWGGTDTLRNIEEVRGSNFDDTLVGSDRTDTTESFEARAGNDSIDGRGGFDRVNFQTSTNGVSVDLSLNRVFNDGFGGVDTLAGIEAAHGGSGADSLVGDAGSNELIGRAGNDTLRGGAGQDTLQGGAGDDLLDGGSHFNGMGWAQSANRSTEFDLANFADATGGVTVDLGDGTNGTATGGGLGSDSLVGIEFVIGGSSGDVLRGSNRAVVEFFRGGQGNDTIFGGQGTGTDAGINFVDYQSATGSVTVNLATGTSSGADGDDSIVGIGNILGSDHADTLVGNDVDNYFDGRGGNDSIDGGLGTDSVSYHNATGSVNINLAGNLVTGAAGTDNLASIEYARGSEFADTINGSAADNGLQGRAGNDSMSGGDGNDTLQGGFGNDTLTGGAGADMFGFEPDEGAMGQDRITDFGTGDSLQFRGLTITSVTGGSGSGLARGQVAVGAYDSGTNTTTISVGVDSVGGADFTIDLVGEFTAANFAVGSDGAGGGTLTYTTAAVSTSPTQGADSLTGTNGPDWIDGLGGNDTILGLDGNDSLRPGAGDDLVDGGAGQDVVFYDEITTGGVTVNLTTGAVTGASGNDTLSGIEHVHGSQADDTIVLGATSGQAFGRAGNDSLLGGGLVTGPSPGLGTNVDDQFWGGSGADTINGGQGFDTANYDRTDLDAATPVPNKGVDVNLMTGVAIDNWGHTDTLVSIEIVSGSDFDDTLTGGNAVNSLFEGFRGGRGADLIDGGAGFDRAYYDTSTVGVTVTLGGHDADGIGIDGFGAGNDTLRNIEEVRGSQHGDVLTGSDTTMWVESFEARAGNDTIDGRGGLDRVNFQTSTKGVNVDLAANTVSQDGWDGVDTLANIEGASGSNFNDTLLGSDIGNDLLGRDGNDSMEGRGGNDTLNGGNGNDTLLGGNGADTLIGGAGNDLLDGGESVSNFGWAASANESPQYDFVSYTDSATGVTVDLGDGTNGQATGDSIGTDTLRNIEYVLGSNSGDFIRGTNRQVTEIFRGGLGNDTFHGGQATGTDLGTNFVTYNNAGGSVSVNLGTNSASGADGNDQIFGINNVIGSNFDDTLVGNAFDNYLDGLDGNDSIDGGAGAGDKVSYQNATGSVTVNLATGQATGAAGNDSLSGIEQARGSEYDDALVGDGNANWFQGRAGNDTIDGAAGNDSIHGGYGDDVLTGGGGNDVFMYGLAGGEGLDRITDFATGDVIRFDGLLAGGAVGAGSTNPSGKGVTAVNGTGFTTLYIDTDGIAGAEAQIRLDGTFDISKFSVTNVGGQAQIEYDKPVPVGSDIDGKVYHWKSHVLMDNVTVSATSASAVAASSDLFDLRGMTYDAATNSITAQVWINPTTGIGSVGFTLSSEAGSAFEFTGAPAGWLVEANVPAETPNSFIVQGVLGSGGTVSTAFQLGTVKITLAPNTTSTTLDFSAMNVDTQNPAAFSIGFARQATGADGQYHFEALSAGDYRVSASRGTSDTGSAINSADALAALRIAVGINPNADPDGGGPLQALKLSPFQVIGADANKDGVVNSADALAILRMAVKAATAPANEWLFVNETLDLWNEAAANGGASALTRLAASWSNPSTPVTGDSSVNFVAVLKGDVNGSWAPAGGAGNLDLDNTNPTYFQNLASQLGVPTDIWGV